jgi:hypothetical protein
MKTLQQVEPRVPISSAPFTISQPGSYYLTTNLTVSGGNAITIATNGVTLDLNGFTISSTTNPASGTAVLIGSGLRNIAIQNGHIQGGVTNNGSGVFSGPGFGYGIYYTGSAPQNVRVSGVSVSGCQYHGIYVGSWREHDRGELRGADGGRYGIVANTIRGCVALDCGGTAIYGQQVSDSRGESVGGTGLSASTAQNCYGSSSSGTGLSATTAQNCYGSAAAATGFTPSPARTATATAAAAVTGFTPCTAQNCYGSSSSGYGLYAYTAQNCYGYSTATTGFTPTPPRTATATATAAPGFTRSWSRQLLQWCKAAGSGYGFYAYERAFWQLRQDAHRPGRIEALTLPILLRRGTNLITYKYNMP